ncbi:hypothetical protein L1049_010407 [Liquidambar formosana]|uniref:RNA polymerase Rpb4/RPC9 core domain-containing protein n=1 Tax=Liquidambar formosana TaxID=63359 RepID=A0AAP0N7M6_LIQFO
MAEKGGKGYSLPNKGGKSSLKSSSPKEASLKGKDDTSAKSKRGRKVQFNSEGSLEDNFNISSKSGGKLEIPPAKGDWSKGGKGDNKVNGGTGKPSVAKEPPKLELKIEPELPKNSKCLMDCEAAQMLEGIQEQMVILSEDPTIKIPLSFNRGLQYAKTGSHYTNPQSVRRVLETLTKHGVSDGEICLIANVCPETVDEVFALVPSLKPKWSQLRGPLSDVLSELAKLKHSTSSPSTG